MVLLRFLGVCVCCVMQVSSDIEIEKEEDEELRLPDEPVCFFFFSLPFLGRIVAQKMFPYSNVLLC